MIGPEWQVWRDDEPRAAALNMALDEALLEHAAVAGRPILRVYRWQTPAVSLGYFDRLAPARTRFPDRDLVRRWTGGGAVDHAADVTFSLAMSRGQNALESYRVIHTWIVEGLRAAGLPARLAEGDAAGAPSSRGEIAPCFLRPVCADVLVAGRKVAGGAQRRTRLGLLHQGSIQEVGGLELRERIRAGLAVGEALPAAACETLFARAAEIAAAKYARVEWLARH